MAVYIGVGARWTKPTYDQPTLPIDSDGAWGGDIWSHPNDLGADRIRVFLVPAAYVVFLFSRFGVDCTPDWFRLCIIAFVAVDPDQLLSTSCASLPALRRG